MSIKLRENFNTYQMGGEWGDRIEWYDKKEFKSPRSTFTVLGWKAKTPKEGDLLLSRMQSGKTARFIFGKVKNETDPPDMFWATVYFIGYVGE